MNIKKMSLICILSAFVMTSCNDEFYEDIDSLNTRYNPAATPDTTSVNINDQDGDTYSDLLEFQLGSDFNDPEDTPLDSDNDTIPDALDAYPFDPARSVKEITIKLLNIDFDVLVNVLGVTKNITPNSQVSFIVGNLDFSVVFSSEKFNEFTECELIHEFDDTFEYSCRTIVPHDYYSQGFNDGVDPNATDMNCFFGFNEQNGYLTEGLYVDAVVSTFCSENYFNGLIDLFDQSEVFSLLFIIDPEKDVLIDSVKNNKYLEFSLMDVNSLDIEQCDKVETIILNGFNAFELNFENCLNLQTLDIRGQIELLKVPVNENINLEIIYNNQILNESFKVSNGVYLIDNNETQTQTQTQTHTDIVYETSIQTFTSTSTYIETNISTQSEVQTDLDTGTRTGTDTFPQTNIETQTEIGTDINTQTRTSLGSYQY